MTKIRHLVLVLGDQLNHDSEAFDDFDPETDRVWMAENDEEATHVWCHQTRLVGFFSPMRHFREELIQRGFDVLYHELTGDRRKARESSFASVLRRTLSAHSVEKILVVAPGDYRVREQLKSTAEQEDVPLEFLADNHFYCSPDQFDEWASGRKSMVMEQFYRAMRKEHSILLDEEGAPEGGQWNFDQDNRKTFGKGGPKEVPPTPSFEPDAITREVIAMVRDRFEDHPGKVDRFDLPVCRDQALESLDDFIEHRLPLFGTYQDAMWEGETFLYHSRLSHSINLHLLSPKEVVDAAVKAYKNGDAPLNCVEGFVRQILGWREYVRGVYWNRMPDYEERNALHCDSEQDVPPFFWDGNTDMACVSDAMRLLVDTAYAHHIQRLMVLGLFAQLFGTHPLRFHHWHMAMYADAIDWVSLPNALGMSQYGDGGLMATKPYCATGKYINRMSNHCKNCRYDPAKSTGDDACPFTTLYWDFLDRHKQQFQNNNRMTLQLKNIERKDSSEWTAIRSRARKIRSGAIKLQQ
ncbi:cryptochrome/photolyase family protein [Rhodopirellula bahusiensis]|uniref:Cryptochrome/photolyase family protein n=1 Tax=Rhodopirellula bahusiensis TaxID=2014065 RepID=A0A2G1W8Q4_9BACT|nr:cryptochrome/photolyase family protein [Rhodopirellula bahusiensis]PHQ35391.1 cryptochrome/photolyase family protein [Rhodopirellula bahusiensis]